MKIFLISNVNYLVNFNKIEYFNTSFDPNISRQENLNQSKQRSEQNIKCV
jgi:hypothetical protein